MSKIRSIHAGEVLREEFLKPMQLSAGVLARAIGVPRTRIERLLRQEVDLSADTAVRLGRYFGTTGEFWMAIQTRYTLETTADALAGALAHIKPMAATD